MATGTTMTPTNLLDLDREGMRQWFVAHGHSAFRADQVLKWIYHQQQTDFAAMSNLGKPLREWLQQHAVIRAPAILSEQHSSDGTVKWLFDVGTGNAIETVHIPEPNRGTLCVSSQVGCALNCSFCATGAQGFNRNLATAEIIGQVWQAARRLGHQRNGARRITNIVMMGMGEPLLNMPALLPALRLMCEDLAFGLAARRVTVSTAGLVPAIDELSSAVDVSLAVSLHAAEDKLRNELVPLNRKYPIEQLLAACARYSKGRIKRSVTYEYTMIDGVNDQPAQARKLVRLLQQVPGKVNLIPFNPFSGSSYRCSPEPVIAAFQQQLMTAGFVATVRRTRGQDIDAACGQLAGDFMDRTTRRERIRLQVAL